MIYSRNVDTPVCYRAGGGVDCFTNDDAEFVQATRALLFLMWDEVSKEPFFYLSRICSRQIEMYVCNIYADVYMSLMAPFHFVSRTTRYFWRLLLNRFIKTHFL